MTNKRNIDRTEDVNQYPKTSKTEVADNTGAHTLNRVPCTQSSSTKQVLLSDEFKPAITFVPMQVRSRSTNVPSERRGQL